MRFMLILALITGAGAAFAADPAPAKEAAKDAKAVNTTCVMCGHAVDDKISPIAGKTTDGKEVMIGCCSATCAAEVKKNPDQYADDAVLNRPWKKDVKVK